MSMRAPLGIADFINASAPATSSGDLWGVKRWLGLALDAATDRNFVLDYELAWFFHVRLERLMAATFDTAQGQVPLVPSGLRPFCPDPSRRMGVIHIGYIRMVAGNCPLSTPGGLPAFEELNWGFQAQPVQRAWHLPNTYVASRLTGTDPTYLQISDAEDRYEVAHVPGLAFETDTARHAVTATSAEGPLCTLDLGETPVPNEAWMVAPVPAEVIKPRDDGTLYRNTFTFIGELQSIAGRKLESPCLRFHRHSFFGDLFGADETIPPERIASVMVSRPGRHGVQVLTAPVRIDVA